MPAIQARPLPPDSLLARHAEPGDRADSYTVDLAATVSLAAFCEAFYTSRAFLPERLALRLIGRGGSRDQARVLSHGRTQRFAAWRVEARSERELLLIDFLTRTRSWLKAEPLASGGTRLWFGTGLIRRDGRGLGARLENAAFRLLLPAHAVYARALLNGAVGRLRAQGQRTHPQPLPPAGGE